ncbi:MAG: hypothetical protein JWN33_103 [Candidatus Saccharibacteria bacterium]|nr:hypothetical protein [Candidatus Saccharibacteria bacterium]
MMSTDLQVTLIGVLIIFLIIVLASAVAGLPLLIIPVFYMGAGAAVGALIGSFFGGPVIGALLGAAIAMGCFIYWFLNKEIQKEQRRRDRLQQQTGR